MNKEYRKIDPLQVIPGKTTESELMKAYGNPDREIKAFGLRYLLYLAQLSVYTAVAISKDGIVRLQAVSCQDTLSRDEIELQYGEPCAIYFSNYAHGARTIAFPEHGRTFVVSVGGQIAQIMYHESLAITDYEDLFGRYFPREDPFMRQ